MQMKCKRNTDIVSSQFPKVLRPQFKGSYVIFVFPFCLSPNEKTDFFNVKCQNSVT